MRFPQTLFQLWKQTPWERKAAERRDLYRRVFATPDGQAVLADMMMTAGFLSVTPPVDAQTMAYREGARWVIAEILQTMDVERAGLARAVMMDDVSEALNERPERYPDANAG
jgi:hypothetical protein